MSKSKLTKKEQKEFIEFKTSLKNMSNVMRLANRRKIRYKIFRIRDGVNNGNIDNKNTTAEYDLVLKKIIEIQFVGFMSWLNFSFDWDVGVLDPLEVITVFSWVESGGRFAKILRPDDTGRTIQEQVCKPTAFTKQEI